MGWLAHHEFGSGHRPFVFSGVRPQGDPRNLDGRLDLAGDAEALRTPGPWACRRSALPFCAMPTPCTGNCWEEPSESRPDD